MTRLLFIALFLSFLAPSLAGAANIQTKIRPVIGRDGAFSFCVAEQKHPGNRYLSIGFSPKENIYMSAIIPKAGFKPKSKYDLRLILDEGFNRKVRAIATDSETLVIDMGRRLPFRKALIASTTLKLSANGNIIPFKLNNMMRIFSALQQCAAQGAESQEQPTASSPKEQQSKTQPTSFPSTLMALLQKAGFTDIMPLSMGDISKEQRPADFIWETNGLLAGVKTRQAPKDKTLTSLIGLHIKGLRLKCKGKFKARVGRNEKTNNRTIRRATASCGPYDGKAGTPISVALLFTLSQKGEFTIFTHESEIGNEDNALAARDMLAKHLLSL